MLNSCDFIFLSVLANHCFAQDSIEVFKEHTPSTTILNDIPLEEAKGSRRHWLVSGLEEKPINKDKDDDKDDDKDENLKAKITTLVEQTMYDTEQKINSIKPMKDQHREQAPYKAGFILSLIKKTKDVLNELFNVAIKHKNDWKALEQLKVFELIVHTNVDTTNLVRQLVEIHIQHMNATNTGESRKRVVLLK